MDPVAEYREILKALNPYLDDLVIIGGVQEETAPPVQTKDLDLATPRRLPVRGRPLLDRLLVESGLKSGQTAVVGRNAPKVKYNLQVGEGEIEFLTELRGNEREEPVLVQEGLYAEKLRYLGLLLEGTWTVDVGEGILVRVPHPGRFIFQKILCFEKRRSQDKAAKDLHYVFYLLDQFPTWQGKIMDELTALKALQEKWFTRFLVQVRGLFLDEDSPGPALVESQRTSGSAPEKSVFEELVRRRIREFHDTLSKE
ncbi:MAG: GSU2403 family nucleotidyltransferase fold protein [Planctomycetota bacterium]|jgi:hypothetical protein